MLLGEVTSASVTVDTPVGSQFPMYSWFVQDDWKVTPQLTLNLGMRWDLPAAGHGEVRPPASTSIRR